jgi:hypothetical protein
MLINGLMNANLGVKAVSARPREIAARVGNNGADVNTLGQLGVVVNDILLSSYSGMGSINLQIRTGVHRLIGLEMNVHPASVEFRYPGEDMFSDEVLMGFGNFVRGAGFEVNGNPTRILVFHEPAAAMQMYRMADRLVELCEQSGTSPPVSPVAYVILAKPPMRPDVGP